jgi:ERCC4-type nuclease
MLTFDTRETKLIEIINNAISSKKINVPYNVSPLAIGDIIIKHISDTQNYSIIIERKTVQDMIASIKDGRYKEQKIRLKAELNNTTTPSNHIKIIYILEGHLDELRNDNEKNIVNGSVISCIFRDQIPVIRTANIFETYNIIIKLFDRLSKNTNDFFNITNNISPTQKLLPEKQQITTFNEIYTSPKNINITEKLNTQTTEETETNPNTNINANTIYINSLSNIKKNKKDNITPLNWNVMCYMNIPGISSTIALKIAEHYPTIKQLINAYEKYNNYEEKISLIANIILTDTDKQKRRIGNVISKRIYDYIVNN